MRITEMIMEWRKGCSCCDNKPIDCKECTLALIEAVDEKAFLDECGDISTKLISEHGVFGVAIAGGQVAAKISQRVIKIRAINEQTNKKD